VQIAHQKLWRLALSGSIGIASVKLAINVYFIALIGFDRLSQSEYLVAIAAIVLYRDL
jgi:hypothetical protein